MKNKIKISNNNVWKILDSIFVDAILEIEYRKNYLEYLNLEIKEKNIICMILLKGIASIFVDDEYIKKENASAKLIMDDMINLLCFITNLDRSIVRVLVIIEV